MRLVTLIFLAIVAFATTSARAQSTALERGMVRAVCSRQATPAAGERLARRLNLTDSQKLALKDLTDAFVSADASTKKSLCTDKPDLSTTPGRMTFAQKRAEIEPWLQAFYDTLDPKQKGALSTGASVVRQSAPHCELPGLEPDTIDVDVWSRMKLDYEQHCHSYKRAAMLVRTKARGPAEAIIGAAMRDKVQDRKAAAPNAVAPADSGVVVQDTVAAPTVTGPTSTGTVSGSTPPLEAKFYRVSAIGAYRNGDLALALVDFDRAIRLDPSVEEDYIDRGIILYRLGVLHAAFDDVARARHIENAHRILTPPLPKMSPMSNKN